MDQFLDIGTGIPTEPNLHQVAQSVNPHARVVYVDNDPIVLAHARALMSSSFEGRTAYLHACVTEPDRIIGSTEVTRTLDLSRPVALSVLALLHFVPDGSDAYGVVERLVSALPSGSALVLSHGTGDFDPEAMGEVGQVYRSSVTRVQSRSREEFARFFRELELVEPGIEVPHRWRPDEPGGAPASAATAKPCGTPTSRCGRGSLSSPERRGPTRSAGDRPPAVARPRHTQQPDGPPPADARRFAADSSARAGGRRRDVAAQGPPGPRQVPRRAERTVRQPLLRRGGPGRRHDRGSRPSHRLPDGPMPPGDRLSARARRADARRQLPAEPGHLRHHVDGAAGRRADGGVPRQEHDRQGRVPAHRRAGAALRGDARRPVERPGPRLRSWAVRRPGRARRACSPGWRSSAAGPSATGDRYPATAGRTW